MLELTADRAGAFLLAAGRIQPGDAVEVGELAGGVSNVVLLVELPSRGERFVVKQARGRLRVQEEWLCPIERIWRAGTACDRRAFVPTPAEAEQLDAFNARVAEAVAAVRRRTV